MTYFACIGPVADASFVCPECQALTGPKSVELINGLLSLVKYGLDSAYGGFGFGRGGIESSRLLGESTYATGSNKYSLLSDVSTTQVVDDLVRVLTSGRILEEKRKVLLRVFDAAIARGAAKEALINIQQLVSLIRLSGRVGVRLLRSGELPSFRSVFQ